MMASSFEYSPNLPAVPELDQISVEALPLSSEWPATPTLSVLSLAAHLASARPAAPRRCPTLPSHSFSDTDDDSDSGCPSEGTYDLEDYDDQDQDGKDEGDTRRKASQADERARLVAVIGWAMSRHVRANELICAAQQERLSCRRCAGCTTAFDCSARRCPAQSVEGFLDRLARTTPASREAFVMALVFVDKVLERARGQGLLLTGINAQGMYSAAFVVASKFWDDVYYANKFYAVTCGMTLGGLNRAERELLEWLQFDLNVDPALFAAYDSAIESIETLVLANPLVTLNGFFSDLVPDLRAFWTSQQLRIASPEILVPAPTPTDALLEIPPTPTGGVIPTMSVVPSRSISACSLEVAQLKRTKRAGSLVSASRPL